MDNKDLIYENPGVVKLRDSEDFKDKDMGKYAEKEEKMVSNAP